MTDLDLELKIESPRVRLAPSPTGPLHIGTARTALFNYLFAKRYEGKFILRIEDTDIERSGKIWENDIMEGLRWLGILWDEGPIVESQSYIGEYGPYRQSKRRKIYQKYIKKLLDEGKAYYCFCTEEELEAKKQYLMSIGQPARYDGTCRDLTKSEVEELLAKQKPSVIRFKTPLKKIVFNDLVHGKVTVDSALLGDMVIAKNESLPLYNLAAVIDDHEMEITHVIRGEDHISNTPKQILMQEALGFKSPQYAHIPLILGPDRSKLSKRHGAISLNEYRKIGYLAEALINFMAFLGWNPGIDREIYSLNSLIKEFSLEKCQKSAAIFNQRKLLWLNAFYIRQKNIAKLTELCIPYLIEAGLVEPIIESEKYPPVFGSQVIKQRFSVPDTKETIEIEEIEKMIALYQERLRILSEIPELIDFFFKKELKYETNLLKWKEMSEGQLSEAFSILEKTLPEIDPRDWSQDKIEEWLLPKAEIFGNKVEKKGLPASLRQPAVDTAFLAGEALQAGDRGYLLWPLRVALSGKEASAGPFEIAEILGREKTLSRIKDAQDRFKT